MSARRKSIRIDRLVIRGSALTAAQARRLQPLIESHLSKALTGQPNEPRGERSSSARRVQVAAPRATGGLDRQARSIARGVRSALHRGGSQKGGD